MKYDNPVLSVNEQIDRLKSLDLVISDEELCLQSLFSIGYYKLRQYFGNFINTNENGQYKFIKGTEFEDILDVYEFDCLLRVTVFEAIMGVEVSVKSILNNVMTLTHGAHWYLNKEVFKKEFLNPSTVEERRIDSCGYDKFIADFEAECNNHKSNNEDSPIKKYCCYYTDPNLPPSWMMLESLTFGKVSMLFQNILGTNARRQIAGYFETHDNILQSWLRSISYLRNLCAHHARITYRNIKPPPLLPSRERNKFLAESDKIEAQKLYYVLCCIQYLSISAKINKTFSGNLLDIIGYYPSVDFAKLGFTEKWRSEKIWLQ